MMVSMAALMVSMAAMLMMMMMMNGSYDNDYADDGFSDSD